MSKFIKKALTVLLICLTVFSMSMAVACDNSDKPAETPPNYEIALSSESISIIAGNTATLTTTTNFDESLIEWTSSNDDVASVVDGVVTGVDVGQATISATYSGVSATCNVTVSMPEIVPEEGEVFSANNKWYKYLVEKHGWNGADDEYKSTNLTATYVSGEGLNVVGSGSAMEVWQVFKLKLPVSASGKVVMTYKINNDTATGFYMKDMAGNPIANNGENVAWGGITYTAGEWMTLTFDLGGQTEILIGVVGTVASFDMTIKNIVFNKL